MIAHVGISQVAKMLGVEEQTVREWEKTGKLIPAHRTAGGHRRYRITDVEKIQNDNEYPEVVYLIRYTNYAPLPATFRVVGSVFAHDPAGSVVGYGDPTDNESFIDLGVYSKSSHSTSIIRNPLYDHIRFDSTGVNSPIQADNDKPTTAHKLTFDNNGGWVLVLQDFSRQLDRKAYAARLSINAWTKLPRLIVGQEACLREGGLSVENVYFNRKD